MSTSETSQNSGPSKTAPLCANVVDDEKPCCSKSIPPPISVIEPSDNFDQSLTTIKNEENSVTVTQSQRSVRLAFSDTVILVSNFEFERQTQQSRYLEKSQSDDCISSSVKSETSDNLIFRETLVSRKSPQVCLIESVPEELPKSDEIRNNNGFGPPTKSTVLRPKVKQSVWLNYDENNNPEECWNTSEEKYLEHAAYIFHKDRRHHLMRTISLLPRHREYIVFNVFGDFARFVGSTWRGTNRHGTKGRKHVAFPEEVMEQYEIKGDVAGKDRFVPVKKQPYRGIQPSKKRRLSTVYSSWSIKSSAFVPKVDRIDDYNKCEYFCERKCLACECCRGPPKKPDLTQVMEGYLCDLNSASLFLHGHATRTFESALSTLEFVKLHVASNSSLAVVGPLVMPKNHLGVLSSSIWTFTYCIRTIIQMSGESNDMENVGRLPSENGFRRVIEQFAALCLTMEEGIKTVLHHSLNFRNFCKECIRILQVLQIHIAFRAEFKFKKPLKRGGGLYLDKKLKKSDIVKMKTVQVMVAKAIPQESEEVEEEMEEWRKFEDLGGSEKVHFLKHLITITSDGVNLVQTQLRFLIDDIVDSVKDVEEADLLFILADMYDRIKYLENLGSSKYIKTEMDQISRLMTEFAKDFQSFIDFGQHIIQRFVEVRDMIHLCYEYLNKGLKLETISEMVPLHTYRKTRRVRCCCCGGDPQGTKKIAGKKIKVKRSFMPKYAPADFFRVAFKEIVLGKGQIYANRFYVQLTASQQLVTSIIPKVLYCNWNEVDPISPRVSYEEYIDVQETDDEANTQEIKPILVTGSPIVSPQGSITSVHEEDRQKGGGGEAT